MERGVSWICLEQLELLVGEEPVPERLVPFEGPEQFLFLGRRQGAFGQEPGPEIFGAGHRHTPGSALSFRCSTHCFNASRSRSSVIRTALSFLPHFRAISADVRRW